MRAKEFTQIDEISRRGFLGGLAGAAAGVRAHAGTDPLGDLATKKGWVAKDQDPLGDFTKKTLDDHERKELVKIFTADLPPAPDTRTTGPEKTAQAKANAKPTTHPHTSDLPAKTKHVEPAKAHPTPVIPGTSIYNDPDDKGIKHPEKHIDKVKPHVEPKKASTPAPKLPQSKGAIPWQEVRDYLLTKIDRAHAIGMLINIFAESSFRPWISKPNDRGGPSGGLCQWHDNIKKHEHRFTDMVKAVPNWESNWKGQLDYALREPGYGKNYLSKDFGGDPVQASWWWTLHFEVPKDADKEARSRTSSQMSQTFIASR